MAEVLSICIFWQVEAIDNLYMCCNLVHYDQTYYRDHETHVSYTREYIPKLYLLLVAQNDRERPNISPKICCNS